jgi:hypothetical protein
MTYNPRPINTSKVLLKHDLNALVERLAAHNHDHWALQRMSEGWRHGEQRDDHAKLHPDLKPYDDLPESEKEYDRISVIQTLKSIVALGYTIRKAPKVEKGRGRTKA